jgi:uncharacterized membrane protein
LEQNDSANLQAVQTRELYQGPIPHPDILKKFGTVDPSYPERIMNMAEENNKNTNTNRTRDSVAGLLGMVFSFALGLAGFGVAAIFGFKGIEAGAIASVIGGVAPIVVAALGNLRK